MKKNKNKSIQDIIAKRITGVFHKDRFKTLRTPHRDWIIVFAVSGIFFILLVVVHIYIFKQVESGNMFSEVIETEATEFEIIDEQALREIIAAFEEKEKRFNEIVNSVPSVVDPSR